MVTTARRAGRRVYVGGPWEGMVCGAIRTRYTLRGQVVQRERTPGGALLGCQEFDPWGAVRHGGIGQMSLNLHQAAQGRDGAALLPCALLCLRARCFLSRGVAALWRVQGP